jgi:hypothetical protein
VRGRGEKGVAVFVFLLLLCLVGRFWRHRGLGWTYGASKQARRDVEWKESV